MECKLDVQKVQSMFVIDKQADILLNWVRFFLQFLQVTSTRYEK